MSAAREGLYAYLYLCQDHALNDGVGTVGLGSVVVLLTGVELNWTQAKRRFYSLGGSMLPETVLDGIVEWNGSFKRAYASNIYLGTFNVGTYRWLGSIQPRGTIQPAIMGTIAFTGGNIRNMAAESNEAVTEEQGFVLYNVKFFG